MPSFQPPRPTVTPPIFPNGNTGGEDWKVTFSPYDVLQLPVMPQDTAGEGRLQPNPFPLLRFFNPSVLRTPPLYFAVQNTEEEEYTLYRNLNKNQPFTEKSGLCLSTRDSSLKSISTPRIFGWTVKGSSVDTIGIKGPFIENKRRNTQKTLFLPVIKVPNRFYKMSMASP